MMWNREPKTARGRLYQKTLKKYAEINQAFRNKDYFKAIVKTGCHIEFYLEYYLTLYFKTPEAFFKDGPNVERFSLAAQLKLAVALGLIPETLKKVLYTMASVRNQYGHKVHYEFTEDEVKRIFEKEKLMRDFTQHFSERFLSENVDVTELIGDGDLFSQYEHMTRIIFGQLVDSGLQEEYRLRRQAHIMSLADANGDFLDEEGESTILSEEDEAEYEAFNQQEGMK